MARADQSSGRDDARANARERLDAASAERSRLRDEHESARGTVRETLTDVPLRAAEMNSRRASDGFNGSRRAIISSPAIQRQRSMRPLEQTRRRIGAIAPGVRHPATLAVGP